MIISSIKQQEKNPERVSIFVDGKYSFSLTLDEVVTEKIKNGQEIDGSRLKQLKKISDEGKIRARALDWVLLRPHSVREFKDYMYRKKADLAMTEALIAEFGEKGYLNDVDFGVWLVEERQRSGKSNRAIKAELFKKGLSRQDVDTVMEGQEETELERLKLLISKKGRMTRYQDDPQKLAKYLVAQGYNWYLVKEALALDVSSED